MEPPARGLERAAGVGHADELPLALAFVEVVLEQVGVSVDRHGGPVRFSAHGVNGLEQAARMIDMVVTDQDGPRLLQGQSEDAGIVENRSTLARIEQKRSDRCFQPD
jgi:hypothetical protein